MQTHEETMEAVAVLKGHLYGYWTSLTELVRTQLATPESDTKQHARIRRSLRVTVARIDWYGSQIQRVILTEVTGSNMADTQAVRKESRVGPSADRPPVVPVSGQTNP